MKKQASDIANHGFNLTYLAELIVSAANGLGSKRGKGERVKKWYTLFRIKNPGTEWMQKIWIFEPLSKKELAKRKNEGWKQSGSPEGEIIRKGGSDETNKNGIVRHKRETR